MDRTRNAPDPNQPSEQWLGLTWAEYKALSPTDRRALTVKRESDAAEQRRAESKARAEAQRQRQAERREAEAAAQRELETERLTSQLRRGFFAADPSADEDAFQKALPGLLERRREEAAIAASTADRARMRSAVGRRLI